MRKLEVRDEDAMEAAHACFTAMMALNNCGHGTLAYEVNGAYGNVKKALLHALAVAFGGIANDFDAAAIVYSVAMDGGWGNEFERVADHINDNPGQFDADTIRRLRTNWAVA